MLHSGYKSQNNIIVTIQIKHKHKFNEPRAPEIVHFAVYVPGNFQLMTEKEKKKSN